MPDINKIVGKVQICYSQIVRKAALDIGTKRIGVAYSDESGKIAFPGKIFDSYQKRELLEYLKSLEATVVVIGKTRDQNEMLENVISEYNTLLTNDGYEVVLQEEAMTSHEARLREFQKGDDTRERKTKMNLKKNIDDVAAMHILQRYLEKK